MPSPSRTTPSVVITGASTGIGRACALHMARIGWLVFAGVRSEADAASLLAEAPERLTPLMLDVTSEASIKQAVQPVQAAVGAAGLDGLVNNAGIPYGGPIEFLSVEKIRQLFDVNYFGMLAVTQAFLPLLRVARGRIVNMSSVGGMVSAPFVSPYSSSKFAMEAASDSLRMELHPWKIHVAVVQPGAIDTPIWNKAGRVIQEVIRTAPPEGVELYGSAINGIAPRYTPHGISTDVVSRAVAHALSSPHPKTRYRIGVEGTVAWLVSRLPGRLRDWLILSRYPKWG